MSDKFTIPSIESKRILKISDCKLMHLRQDGVLRAEKKGNAFLYHEDDIKEYLKINVKKKK